MSDIGKKIGKRIRDLRTLRPEKWTQEDLAEKARISVSFLSMIERGERVAHVETLEALSAALGVSLSELFAGTEEVPVPTGTNGHEVQAVLLRPIEEFVKTHRLDSHDVERLLGVARAMFNRQSA